MEEEMQHYLAGIITKILNQKSIRESVAHLHELVVEELEQEVKEKSEERKVTSNSSRRN